MTKANDPAQPEGLASRLRSILTKQPVVEKVGAFDTQAQTAETLRRMIMMTLDAVAHYAIPGDQIEYEQFQSDLRYMSERFSNDVAIEDVLIFAGQFRATMKDYFEHTSRFLSTHNAEYQKMISMLTATVASLRSSGERSVVNLQDIEKQIERATVVEDIRTLRLRLGQCLESIGEEIRRQEAVSSEFIDLLAQSTGTNVPITEIGADKSQELKRDPLTGLATQKDAEAALFRALQGGHTSYVAVIVANGADKVYAQCGREIGDNLLRKFSKRLDFMSKKGDQLFQWGGVVFVAVLSRSGPSSDVKRELSELNQLQFDDPIEVGDRLMWLPVSAYWEVIPVTPPFSSVVSKINKFAGSLVKGNGGRAQ